MFYLMLRRFAKNDNIVEVNESELQFNSGQYHVHDEFECVRGVAKSKWHTNKAIETWWDVNAVLFLSESSILIC